MPRWSLAAAFCVLFAAPAAAGQWTPVEGMGHRIDGVWRSQGYGHILVWKNGRAILYHVAGPWCYRDPDSKAGTDDAFRQVAIDSRDRIALSAAPGQTRYVFDRTAALPTTCRTERRWTPADIGKLVAATFADLYPGFGRRGRSRPVLTAALATLPADADQAMLYDRLKTALDGLDDAHVGLTAEIDGKERAFESGEAPTLLAARRDPALGDDPSAREREWSRRYREGIVALLDGGGHHVANRRILWGTIGRTGYINIVTMGDLAADVPPDDTVALDAALDDAMRAFARLDGVIVDVTNNRGGYDAIGLRIAARFTGRSALAFSKRGVGATVPFQSFHVTPSPRARFTGPVMLLTSDITVSAAETFTLAMRALPNVRHVGARTRGALSDQLVKPLPNGWTLTLPAEIYHDPARRSAEGIGIAPGTTIFPFSPTHAAVIARLAAGLVRKR